MKDYIVFADGTSEHCSYLSYLPDLQLVYIQINGADWMKMISLFTDPEKLTSITYNGVAINGYTNVDYIEPVSGGMKVRLSPTRE